MSTWAYRKCSKCGASGATIQDRTVAYHRFPNPGTTNILRATAWATYCWPEKDWSSLELLTALHKNAKVICGRHFEDSCYRHNTSKKRLSNHAVPGSKEYKIKLLHSLRSKIPSIIKKVCSQNSPIASSSMEIVSSAFQQQESQAELPISKVAPSLDIKEPDSVTHPVTPANINTPPQAPAEAGTSTEPTSSANTGIRNTKKKRIGILKKIDKTRLSELTPTEQRLYKICINKVNRISKIKKQFKGKPKIDKIMNICDNECVKKLFELKLSNSCILLLQSQIINCQRKKQGRRYSLEQKILALTLYKKSPACYRLLRQMFSLPCPSSLNSLLNQVPMKPGINAQVFNGLKAMAETLTDDQKICVLSFDEMAIRKHLQYNTQTDSVDGFQDHGEHGRTGQVACNALVFMVCGLRSNWKQPIAYYLNGKSSFSDRLSVIIKEVLSECFKSGLNVVSTVCDMCSVNTKALRALGATTETPYFVHDGREIVTIADPPHLLKCLRNLFMTYNVEYPTEIQPNGKTITGIAKWDHVKQFYALDKLNPHFVYAPVLTDKHISPNTKQKMRVKLAAQVFSHTVSMGILTKIGQGELPSEAGATATFLKNFDELFDALNANSPDLRRGKKLSSNLTSRSPHLKYFEIMKRKIKEMRFVNARNTPSQSGWVQTITAVERLWRNLKQLGLQSLSTRRLNQDPLENFFGCVRYNCGSNYNPTISQFMSGFKSSIISNLRHNVKNKNCEDDDGVLSNNFRSFLMGPITQKENQTLSEESDTPQKTEAPDSELEAISSELQACAYVCGFIVKKIDKSCDKCNQLLTSSPGSEPAHIFTQFKEYEDHIHSLTYSSQNLITAVEKTANVIKTYLDNNLQIQNLEKNGILLLRSDCKDHFIFLQTCAKHYETNFNDILFHTFKICLKRYITLKNREFSEEASKRALSRKMIILQNK